MQETDILTFRNHKGEEKKITRQEFRNAARGQQDIDHRPKQALEDRGQGFKQSSTPEDRKFQLTQINGKEV